MLWSNAEMIKQKLLQLEQVLGIYGACKFSHTSPMEKLSNYKPLMLQSGHMVHVYDMYAVKMCQYISAA